jgi:hypothetical protein
LKVEEFGKIKLNAEDGEEAKIRARLTTEVTEGRTQNGICSVS